MSKHGMSYLGHKKKELLLNAAIIFEERGQTAHSYIGKYCTSWTNGPSYQEDFIQTIKYMAWLIDTLRD